MKEKIVTKTKIIVTKQMTHELLKKKIKEKPVIKSIIVTK